MADLRNTRLSSYFRTRLLNGFGMADWDGALIRIYSDNGGAAPQPATPETAVGSAVLLVTPSFGTPAFAAASAVAGVISTTNITQATIGVSGIAKWGRILIASAAQVLMDFEIGAVGDANTDNLELPTTTLTQGVDLDLSSFTFTLPMQGL